MRSSRASPARRVRSAIEHGARPRSSPRKILQTLSQLAVRSELVLDIVRERTAIGAGQVRCRARDEPAPIVGARLHAGVESKRAMGAEQREQLEARAAVDAHLP
jgi:hypothetical protein